MKLNCILFLTFIVIGCRQPSISFNEELGVYQRVIEFRNYKSIEYFNQAKERTDSFSLVNNEIEGDWNEFFPNGNISSQKSFRNSKIHGINKYYKANGLLKAETWYHNDSGYFQRFYYHEVKVDSFKTKVKPIISDEFIDSLESTWLNFKLLIPSKILLDSFKTVQIRNKWSTEYNDKSFLVNDNKLVLSGDYVMNEIFEVDTTLRIKFDLIIDLKNKNGITIRDTFNYNTKYVAN